MDYFVQKQECKSERQKRREAERALRRNVRLKLKLGYYDDLPVAPKNRSEAP
jgi:hypothetical protein